MTKKEFKPKPKEVFWYEIEFEGWIILALTTLLLVGPLFLVWFVKLVIFIAHSKLQWF